MIITRTSTTLIFSAQRGFEPFYYTALTHFYGSETPEETINLEEWKKFFGGKVPEKDLNEFIYGFSRSQMSNLYMHIEKRSRASAGRQCKVSTR